MNALRLTEGVPAAWLPGHIPASAAPHTRPAAAGRSTKGLLDTDPALICALPRWGGAFSMILLQYFLA